MTQFNFDPSYTEELFTPDDLIAGGTQPITAEITVPSGAVVSRGDLLGKITSSGFYILSIVGAGDGSEIPTGIAAQDTDATAADSVGVRYIKGEFNENAITFGAGHTIASTKDGLADIHIFLKSSVQRG